MSPPTAHKAFRLALIQMQVTANKAANLAHARSMVQAASRSGAQVVVLPECFNSPYGTSYFQQYSEPELDASSASATASASSSVSPTVSALSTMARESKVYLIGGSFPEQGSNNNHLYNTCTVWDPLGARILTHRKAHLFDIDVPGGICFKESEVLTAGDSISMVDTEYGRIGVGICYDMRFPEMAMVAARRGCVAMVYPGAFNTTTGPLHWELLQRARALDNQIYVAACSPARDLSASYVAWGHSSVVDPMGVVVATTDESESIVYADVDPAVVSATRQAIPVYSQRRFDLYPDVADKAVGKE
ncbi:hypothetical protein BASA50_006938 [Batrachochytrium salamandrivorans]|uniref:CN hydrolase domain-containing protein n=1 Tax=Batrachochytrium salamandrivorans TaxID=1357716 RepID=A0ABQ8F8H0_9FUNG|nr:hypothetical protein BASA62_009308 [Batrachochytrium salamandrivorans]KAH6583425.1 hypothetical protein BASA60_001451 [Batrachochytrium salamandrivorans]KAH6594032.1 hypothetical protein BASA50_006938 [Batrachochytrium salamandrivorans]